jgi:hypothetical protein
LCISFKTNELFGPCQAVPWTRLYFFVFGIIKVTDKVLVLISINIFGWQIFLECNVIYNEIYQIKRKKSPLPLNKDCTAATCHFHKKFVGCLAAQLSWSSPSKVYLILDVLFTSIRSDKHEMTISKHPTPIPTHQIFSLQI